MALYNGGKNVCEFNSPSPILSNDLSEVWILASWWSIWKGRNEFIFKGKALRPLEVMQEHDLVP